MSVVFGGDTSFYGFTHLAGMMYFQDIHYLWLGLLLPVLMVCWLLNWLRQRRATALLGKQALIKGTIIISPLWLQIAKYGLFLTALAMLILALAQPYSMSRNESGRQLTPADIVFVVDVSKSMYVKDMAPDRLSRARQILKNIVSQLTDEQVGVVIFAGKANSFVPPTTDYYYVKKSVEAISGELVSQQGTSLHEALKIAALVYGNNSGHTRVLCLLSDGEFHDRNAFGMADSLRKSGVRLFSIGLGTPAGAQVPANENTENELPETDVNGRPVISRLQSKSLIRMAGNSSYIQAAGRPDAANLFINRLNAIEDSTAVSAPVLCYRYFLVAAFLLLLTDTALPQIFKSPAIDG